MPQFVYRAVDSQGHEVTATLEAPSRKSVIERLSAQQLCPVTIEAEGKESAQSLFRSARVSKSEVEAFTRELASLLQAGVNLSRALAILGRETSKENTKLQWQAIGNYVSGGMPLADALAQFPRSFPSVTIAMVKAGETGGFLDLVLSQIADFRTREQDLIGKVRAALIYPIILAVMSTAILIFLLTYFIPRFATMFDEFGGTLPLLTRAIVSFSDILLHYGLLLVAGIALAVMGLQRYLATPEGRYAMERVLLRVPLLGTAIGRFALIRFCRMLGTLVGAGVPLLTALHTAKEAIGNEVLAEALSTAIENVQRGQTLARSLALCPELFPASVIEMVSVAEESGRLEQELVRLAGTYEQNLDRHLKMMVAIAEPAMLFLMAVLVGTVVIGMLLPIFNLQELIQ